MGDITWDVISNAMEFVGKFLAFGAFMLGSCAAFMWALGPAAGGVLWGLLIAFAFGILNQL